MLLKVNLINCNLCKTLVPKLLHFPFRRKSIAFAICSSIQIDSAALVLLFLHFGVREPSWIVLCKVLLILNIRVIDSDWGRWGVLPGFNFLVCIFLAVLNSSFFVSVIRDGGYLIPHSHFGLKMQSAGSVRGPHDWLTIMVSGAESSCPAC